MNHAPVDQEKPAALVPVRIWDLPTRLFHWALVLLVVCLVITAKRGGDAMVWHMWMGQCVMGLLLFRVLWGLVGGRWSRFASFVYAPGTIWRYLRGGSRPDEHHEVGHNPLGSLSVLAMLTVLAVQVATGLVADDEIATVGPLNKLVASATAASATSWHKTGGQWLIYLLVAAHVAAIIGYRVLKKKNLVGPMLRGDKLLPPGVPAAADAAGQRLLALVLAVLAGGAAYLVVRLGS